MKAEQRIDDLKVIREMMEKSSKFKALSGITGVVIGLIALLGALFIYFSLSCEPFRADSISLPKIWVVFFVAVSMIVLSGLSGIWLSVCKAKRLGQKLPQQVIRQTLYNFSVPMAAGGVICIFLLFRGELHLTTALTLIFYGLALLNISRYTYEEVHYLGLTELIIGLLAVVFDTYVLLFWIAGFGLCHILYGLILYFKYDRRNR